MADYPLIALKARRERPTLNFNPGQIPFKPLFQAHRNSFRIGNAGPRQKNAGANSGFKAEWEPFTGQTHARMRVLKPRRLYLPSVKSALPLHAVRHFQLQRVRTLTPVLVCLLGLWLAGCAGSSQSKVIAPVDLPEICRDIDFNTADEGIKKECGVKTRSYMAYRNVPEHRSLLLPKNGKIVQKEEALELRLEGFIPVALPSDFTGFIAFGEGVRRQFLKSKYDYFEYFPPKATRSERIIKIEIPGQDRPPKSVCFFVERQRLTSQRKVGYASRLLPLDCQEFERRKTKFSEKQNEESPSTLSQENAAIDSSQTPKPR